MTQVQYNPATRAILGYGAFPTAPPDVSYAVADVSDTEAAKLTQPGSKTLNADGTISIDPSAYLTLQQDILQQQQDQQAARSQVAQLLQSCVGVTWQNLTAQQKQAIVVAALYKFGALDKTLTVQPLGQWL